MMNIYKNGVILLSLLILPFSLAAGQDDGGARTIEITGSDQMKYDMSEITAAPGEEIHIVLTTVSNLPKIAMAHNFILLVADSDAQAFATAAATERTNDYIPPQMEDQIIAHTGLAGGGETVEVTFTVPDTPGSYAFICSFPGHFAAGMRGTLIVEEPEG